MDLSRDSIERSDFPRAQDGLDPAAVEAHLREVADAVEKLTRSVRRLAAELEERAGRGGERDGAKGRAAAATAAHRRHRRQSLRPSPRRRAGAGPRPEPARRARGRRA